MTISRFEKSKAIDSVLFDEGELQFNSNILSAPRQLAIHYVDINSNYRASSSSLIVYDRTAVNQQMSNLFATPKGSEAFYPTYGSDVSLRLFEAVTETTAWLLRSDVFIALDTWMSDRVRLDYANCSVTPINGNVDSEGYNIILDYQLLSSRTVHNYSAFLSR